MIWVIGCRGMLGTELCRQLSESGIDFIGTDSTTDITDFSSLESFCSSHDGKIDFIVNCAAYTAVDKAESDEALAEKINYLGAGNVAKIAKKIGAKLIHVSTDYVFDGTGKTPYAEDDPIAPLGVYGRTKALGEKAVSESGADFYILRTAWLYGWAGKNFVYTMLRAMNMRESVKVVCDQRGTPTFCGTLARVIIQIAKSGNVPFGIYHVTDEGETTWFEFTKEIQRQAKDLSFVPNVGRCAVNSCTTEEYPTPAKRPAYSVLSKQKIQSALSMKLPSWQESLGEFLSGGLFDKSRVE